ncbi:UNVERIFIED_CONTAM: hypothetical protein Scaly_2134600 [Sesamum calycinum]|uniref:Uncharacterized protein n=1 Tax=Sesamum calycinum TaxID=2727403 RepID=A0AAW2MPI0_9LAMI
MRAMVNKITYFLATTTAKPKSAAAAAVSSSPQPLSSRHHHLYRLTHAYKHEESGPRSRARAKLAPTLCLWVSSVKLLKCVVVDASAKSKQGFCYKPRILHYHHSLEACFFIIFCGVMDPKHSGDMLKHLEKQNELLMDAYRSMSHELHKLQVEEEMLMRKYYEFMEAQGLIDKNKSSTNLTEDQETGQAGPLVVVTREEHA